MPGAGGAGNQDVRHPGQIGHAHISGNVLTERDLDVGVGRGPGLALHNLAQGYDGRVVIRRFKAYEGLPRHRRLNAHAAGGQLEGEVVGERGNA